MRPNLLRLFVCLVFCVTLVVFALPSSASADEPAPEEPSLTLEELPEEKVEEPLAELAEDTPVYEDVEIIVFRGAESDTFRSLARDPIALPLIGATSAKVQVGYLDELAADPEIGLLLADRPVAQSGAPFDYSKLASTYPTVDRASKPWNKGFTGTGVGIAVIDSGVAALPDFAERLHHVTLPGQSWTSEDTHGHGSLVAGIAAGQSSDGKYIGIAPGARVFALNVNSPQGVRSSDVILALQWVFDHAHENNIRVVNLSLSESVPSSYTQSLLDLAVERVWAAGIVVVVSAGNLGQAEGAADFAPANDPLVLTVGATDTKQTLTLDDDVVADFSSVGVSVDGFGKPEVLAPGRLIPSTLPTGTVLDQQAPEANRVAPGYATISGTSFAAPQVAAAAALLLQRNPGWSPDQVKWTLIEKSRSLSGSSGRTLDLDAAWKVIAPGRANQGVPALVCAPGTLCHRDGESTIASKWSSATWNAWTWNAGTWNAATWNVGTWNAGTWNAWTWNAGTWNAGTWNAGTWNAWTWNAGTWNAGTWN